MIFSLSYLCRVYHFLLSHPDFTPRFDVIPLFDMTLLFDITPPPFDHLSPIQYYPTPSISHLLLMTPPFDVARPFAIVAGAICHGRIQFCFAPNAIPRGYYTHGICLFSFVVLSVYQSQLCDNILVLVRLKIFECLPFLLPLFSYLYFDGVPATI